MVPINQTAGEDIFTFGLVNDVVLNDWLINGSVSPTYDYLINNPINDPIFISALKQTLDIWKNTPETFVYNRNVPSPPIPPRFVDPFGQNIPIYNAGGARFESDFRAIAPGSNIIDPISSDLYFYTTANNGDVIKNLVILKAPVNLENCNATYNANGVNGDVGFGGAAYDYVDANNNLVTVDGAYGGNGDGPGVVEGTPTAIINNNEINQTVDGASVQFNWNFENINLWWERQLTQLKQHIVILVN